MKQMKIVGIFLLFFSITMAEEIGKHTLKCNMMHIYEETPKEVLNIKEIFSEGMFYGRLRFNSFGFKWKEELVSATGKDIRKDHAIAAIGGSVIFKSASYYGLSVGAGVYLTQAHGSLNKKDAYLYKAGKGVLNRYDVLTHGKTNIVSLAEAYLQYTYLKSRLKVGRQKFESFLTKSNDTKMIPNTFEGLTIESQIVPDTTLQMAYLTKQKLRDHSRFHHLLSYGDNNSYNYGFYRENDDSAMHIGLKSSKLKAKNIEDRLIIFEAINRSMDNLTIHANYTSVPKLISSVMFQMDYRVDVGKWTVVPALRYMQQFDNGAGTIGGANLKTLTSSYTNPNSLDSALYAVKVDVVNDGFKLRFAYTSVANKGDIVAPWRGFPTGGFTRAMGQYNWYANTKTYMVQLDYAFKSIPNFKIISRFAMQDFDDKKIGVQADSNIFTLDFLKVFDTKKLYLKTRYAHVMGEKNTIASNGMRKLDPSYDEIRFEINYLF